MVFYLFNEPLFGLFIPVSSFWDKNFKMDYLGEFPFKIKYLKNKIKIKNSIKKHFSNFNKKIKKKIYKKVRIWKYIIWN